MIASHATHITTDPRRHHAAPLPKNSAKRQRHSGSTQPQTTTAADLQGLGITYQIAQPPHTQAATKPPKNEGLSAAAESARKDRFYRQDIAQTILMGDKRLNACCKALAPDKTLAPGMPGQVRIMQTVTATGSAYHLKGLQTCGSVWQCPVCSARISERRREELSTGLDRWVTAGHGVSMATLTAPHYINTRLDKHLAGIGDALRTWTNRPSFKRIAERIGLVGRVRALEVTHGQNGWHSHYHILFFTESPIDAESLPVLETEMLKLWQSACVSAGLPEPNENGFKLAAGNAAAGDYVSKWGAAEEMTKSVSKTGQQAGQVTPFGLLAAHAGGDTKAAGLFREYAKCFKGKRQLVWSKGLRDLLQLGIEKTDEQLAAEDIAPATEFMQVPLNVWQSVVRRRARGSLIAACQGGLDSVYDFLIELMNPQTE